MPICPLPTERERGFTLIEMLVVLTVIGMVAAIMAARLQREPGSFRRARAAQTIENAIAAAHAQAAASSIAVRVAPSELVSGATLTGAVFDVEPGDLIVYPDGSTSGGTIGLSGQALVEVDWLTGAVRRND